MPLIQAFSVAKSFLVTTTNASMSGSRAVEVKDGKSGNRNGANRLAKSETGLPTIVRTVRSISFSIRNRGAA